VSRAVQHPDGPHLVVAQVSRGFVHGALFPDGINISPGMNQVHDAHALAPLPVRKHLGPETLSVTSPN
jgi:hypothetical protein